jgi:hypothetical protein
MDDKNLVVRELDAVDDEMMNMSGRVQCHTRDHMRRRW